MKKEDIILLVEAKKFDQLTEQEQAMVLSEMTVREYDAQRQVVLASKQLFEEVAEEQSDSSLDAGMAATILANTRSQRNAKEPRPIWAKPIPIWQAAAAIIVVLLAWWQWPQQSTINYAQRPEVITQIVRDTIELVKEIPIEKVVTKVMYKEVEQPQPDAFVPELAMLSNGGIGAPTATLDLANVTRSFGNSGIDKSKLGVFRREL